MISKKIIFFSLIATCVSYSYGMQLYLKDKKRRELSSGSAPDSKKNRKRGSGHKTMKIEVVPIIEQLIAENKLEVYPFHLKQEAIAHHKKLLQNKKGFEMVGDTLFASLSKDTLIGAILGLKGYFEVKTSPRQKDQDGIFELEL